jgi:vacuolar-type H+-ATPase subunit I/STV1
VKSRVRPEVFQLFLDAVKGASVTNQNFSELSQLCSEFAFKGLADELSVFRSSPAFKDAHSAEARICALEERSLQHEQQIAALERIVNSETSKQEQTAGALERIKSTSAVQAEVQNQTTEAVSAAQAKLDELKRIVDSQVPGHEQTAETLNTHSAAVEQLRRDVVALLITPRLDSPSVTLR